MVSLFGIGLLLTAFVIKFKEPYIFAEVVTLLLGSLRLVSSFTG